uniref:Uncharacterized protein n=1 Tax=Arundo donax TaxID=35708 RepID=A0A0A9GQN3_ARUDO
MQNLLCLIFLLFLVTDTAARAQIAQHTG